jgi:phosphoglycolate phosphatase
MTRPIVHLDLDGTLIEPSPGIFACIRYAFGRLSKSVPKDADLHSWIGPPLRDSFAEHLGADQADAAVAAYRERYAASGWRECALYPGIVDALTSLDDAGYDLVLATSKPFVYATRIVGHFKLTSRFVDVCGAELDGQRSDKAELLAHAQARNDHRGIAMIGDRRFDIEGARANGLTAVAAGWGFGSREELLQAGADIILTRPEEIADAMPRPSA